MTLSSRVARPQASVSRDGSCLDPRHLHLRVVLSVTRDPAIPLPPLKLLNPDLVAFAVLEDFDLDTRTRNIRRADFDVVAIGNEQHILESQGFALLSLLQLDLELHALFHFFLKAGDVDNRKHAGRV